MLSEDLQIDKGKDKHLSLVVTFHRREGGG